MRGGLATSSPRLANGTDRQRLPTCTEMSKAERVKIALVLLKVTSKLKTARQQIPFFPEPVWLVCLKVFCKISAWRAHLQLVELFLFC